MGKPTVEAFREGMPFRPWCFFTGSVFEIVGYLTMDCLEDRLFKVGQAPAATCFALGIPTVKTMKMYELMYENNYETIVKV